MRDMLVAVIAIGTVLLLMGMYMGSNYSNTQLKAVEHERDSLQAELSKYQEKFREHLRECSWISKAQIKNVTNGIYITLYKPYEEHE